jgi:hypothetical protein
MALEIQKPEIEKRKIRGYVATMLTKPTVQTPALPPEIETV